MLSINSPAKINWFLKITGRRPDGYHDIHSVMQRIALHDTLHFEESEGGEIVVESNLGIAMEENLVYRAAGLLKRYARYPGGARIRLTKRIPVQAGLGGGSSNAAATLRGLNRLWRTGLDAPALSGIGARLGSDVPFFLNGPIAAVEGRGEKVTPLPPPERKTALLIIKPAYGVSTALAYKNVSGYSAVDASRQAALMEALDEGVLGRLGDVVCNDLEGPVFGLYPGLGALKERLLESGAAAALLCGSGSALFGVFASREDAEGASGAFSDLWHVVTETVSG